LVTLGRWCLRCGPVSNDSQQAAATPPAINENAGTLSYRPLIVGAVLVVGAVVVGFAVGGNLGGLIVIVTGLIMGLTGPVNFAEGRNKLAMIADGRLPAADAGPSRMKKILGAISTVIAVALAIALLVLLFTWAADGIGNWFEWIRAADREDEIRTRLVEHAQLVLTSMFWATIVGVGAGIVAHRFDFLRGPFLGIAAFFLTIPSFALFAVFIPISFIGIGDRGPIIAMAMYAQLPIMRNTITGLSEVDPSVVESAKGMGMSAFQRLRKIEMPLAWPVILTGLRVATLLTVGIAAIAVLVGGGGLGRFVQDGLTRHGLPTAIERTWTGVVFILILAQLLDLGFGLLRRLTTPKGLK